MAAPGKEQEAGSILPGIWKGAPRDVCGRRRNAVRPCGRREPWPALQCLLWTCALKSPRFSQRREQLCHLRRLQAEGSGKTARSHFVHASTPAGSKAWKGACPGPVEVWRSLPASSASLEGDASLAAVLPRGRRERAGASAGRAEGVGAPSSGAGPGWRTEGSRRVGSFPKATVQSPGRAGGRGVRAQGLDSSRLCLAGCLGLSGRVC